MVDAKNRLVALAVLAGVGLSGCELNQKDPNYPDSITPTTFTATYNVEAGQTPWPNDAFFFGSTDGSLNIPAPYNAAPFTLIGTPLNTQDGWSISAPANTSLSQSIDGSTLAGSVRVVEVYLSNTTKFPASAAELPPGVASPVIRVLTPASTTLPPCPPTSTVPARSCASIRSSRSVLAPVRRTSATWCS